MNHYFEEQERTFRGAAKEDGPKESAFGAESTEMEAGAETEKEDDGALPSDVGHECTLFANFFRIMNHPSLTLTWLTVDVSPELPEGEMRNWVLRKIFRTITP